MKKLLISLFALLSFGLQGSDKAMSMEEIGQQKLGFKYDFISRNLPSTPPTFSSGIFNDPALLNLYSKTMIGKSGKIKTSAAKPAVDPARNHILSQRVQVAQRVVPIIDVIDLLKYFQNLESKKFQWPTQRKAILSDKSMCVMCGQKQ